MLRYMCAFLDLVFFEKISTVTFRSQWWHFQFFRHSQKGDNMSEGMAALCLFVFWFAVPETMVTRVGLARAFFDLLPVKSWIDFLFSLSSFGHYKKSGLIYFDKFQLQPHQHPPWNSTTISKKWCFRLDDTYLPTWKLVEPCTPTYKTWAKPDFQGPDIRTAP